MTNKVRFNLGKGKHFLHWQITKSNGEKLYVDPKTTNLIMTGCKLRNQPATATRIHNGQRKEICAWVDVEHVFVGDSNFSNEGLEALQYNPKVAPHWRSSRDDSNHDNRQVAVIRSQGNKLYTTLN